jgi:hypothetical protein
LLDTFVMTRKLDERGLAWSDFFARRRHEQTIRVAALVLMSTLRLFGDEPLLRRLNDQAGGDGGLTSAELRSGLSLATLASRRSAFRYYQGSMLKHWAWWSMSRPFELAAYSLKVRRCLDQKVDATPR